MLCLAAAAVLKCAAILVIFCFLRNVAAAERYAAAEMVGFPAFREVIESEAFVTV